MNWRASAWILMAALLAGCGKPAAPPANSDKGPDEKPADPPNVRTVSPTQQWRGEVGGRVYAEVAPKSLVVTTPAEFEKVWKAFWPHGQTPAVDFATSFVAVVTWTPGQALLSGVAPKAPPQGTDGVQITALKVLPDGSAILVMSPHTSDDEKWVATKGFYWGISVFPRAGITSVNGTPPPPP